MNPITLTQEQKEVVEFAVERLRTRQPITTIGGLAGTGKTTIMGEIVNCLRAAVPGCSIAFACYTGKAKDVLERKLNAAECVQPQDFVGTLHSLLYRAITNEERETNEETQKDHIRLGVDFARNETSQRLFNFIIIDEASMMDERIYGDVMQLSIPVLAVGDHGQLPPIAGKFNLMGNPMKRLEKIHRQAENNPIIRLSMVARETGQIPFGIFGEGVEKTRDGSRIQSINNIEEWMLICGTNRKRSRLNAYVRQRKFTIPPEIPQPGEKVICLQNNHAKKIFNGMIGTLRRAEIMNDHWLLAEIDMGDFIFNGEIFRYQFGYERTCKETMAQCDEIHPQEFGDLFDYGYCLTAHKSQGSEADSVVVYEEQVMRNMQIKSQGEEGWRRWLYTAITRAKKNLIIIGE